MTLPNTTTPQPKPRKRFLCAGCGGWTDGRHLDRELLPQPGAVGAEQRIDVGFGPEAQATQAPK